MKTRIRAALGKRVNGNLYFHVTALERLNPDVREQVQRAALQAGLEIEDGFNVIKITEEGGAIKSAGYSDKRQAAASKRQAAASCSQY